MPLQALWRSLRTSFGAPLRDLDAFAYPQRCPGCGVQASPTRVLCDDCIARIPPARVNLCVRCLATERDPHGCARHPGYVARAAWIYDERAAAVVQALKYEARPAVAAAFGDVLASAVPREARSPAAVIDVPLHPVRERERGYNQAAVLADALADVLGAPRVPGALRRVRVTAPQAHLGAAQRRANLVGAFVVGRPRALAGRSVLVVDDVLTTGATLEAALAALRADGAQASGVALAWAV